MDVVVYEGRRYDISRWIPHHPGGQLLLRGHEGTDVTDVFKAYHAHARFERPEIRRLDATHARPPFAFTDEYRRAQRELHAPQAHDDLWDVVMWVCLALYFWSTNPVVGGFLLVVLGAFGHQYVHLSSSKASLITLVGFVSHHWRHEHVFSHHAATNTVHDRDLSIYDANALPLPPSLRFAVVANVIVFRPFLQYAMPRYNRYATKLDACVMLYNCAELYHACVSGVLASFWVRRILPAAWFLLIDYYNHYHESDVRTQHADWTRHQYATTQNFVVNEWLYHTHPMVHSLLTFGLDRQVEHHLFPRVKLHRLCEVERQLPVPPRKHVLGLHTFTGVASCFV